MGKQNKQRFIIYTTARSGSTLLMYLLDSHPDIRCEGELFDIGWKYITSPPLITLLKFFPICYPAYRRWRCPVPVYGFKLMQYHLFKPRKTIKRFANRGWKIVHLIRHNIFNRAISLAVAEKTGVYSFSESRIAARIRIAPEDFLSYMVLSEKSYGWAEEILMDIDRLTLSYEDDLEVISNREATSKRLCDYLGVPHRLLTTSTQKTHRRPYSDLIENYDEIVAFVGSTRYRNYLP